MADEPGDSPGSRRRILYLTHRVPYPPNRGDRIRSYHTLRFLASRCDVDLACLADEPVSENTLHTLQSLCRRVAVSPLAKWKRWARAATSLARGRSATEGLFYSPELAARVHAWAIATRYDAVIAFCSSMAPYLDVAGLRNIPAIVDLVDVDSQKWFDYADQARGPARWLFRWEGRRVRKLEQQLAKRAQALLVVSPAEVNLLRQFCPEAPVHAVPNGVDLDYFSPAPDDASVVGFECVFVGALDYRANIDGLWWFCQEVWPQVQARFPAAEFVIVGRRPVPQVQRLAHGPASKLLAMSPSSPLPARPAGGCTPANRSRHPKQGAGSHGSWEACHRFIASARRLRRNSWRARLPGRRASAVADADRGALRR